MSLRSTATADARSPIHELIQRRRHELAMSMSDIADRAGITRSHLYSLLNGSTRDPSVHTLSRLSAAQQVSPIVLLRHYLHGHRHTADCPALMISHTPIGGNHLDNERDENETKNL